VATSGTWGGTPNSRDVDAVVHDAQLRRIEAAALGVVVAQTGRHHHHTIAPAVDEKSHDAVADVDGNLLAQALRLLACGGRRNVQRDDGRHAGAVREHRAPDRGVSQVRVHEIELFLAHEVGQPPERLAVA
jgi:hypothetical protein